MESTEQRLAEVRRPRYRLPTTSGHASSWLLERAEAAAKQEQRDFLAEFKKVDAAAMANKPIHGKATARRDVQARSTRGSSASL
jgi:hypothetical protein